MNDEYDLYKVYGLTKVLQENEQLQDKLLREVFEELGVDYDKWCVDYDIYYENDVVTIERVKELCDDLIKRAKK